MRKSLVVLVCVVAALVGCEMTPAPRADAPDKPPADFGVSVTVFAPGVRRAGEAGPTRTAATTPARYIVEPDGTLRAAVGAGATPTTFPPIVRRLSDRQRQRVWWLTVATGAHDPAPADRIDSPETYRPVFDEGDGAVALITVSWLGGRASQADPVTGGSAAEELTAELAGLAWVEP